MDCGEGNSWAERDKIAPTPAHSAQGRQATSLKRCGFSLAASWNWTQALMLSCTNLPRKQHNCSRLRRTIRPKSRGPCTPLPDQCSTHLGLEPEATEASEPEVLELGSPRVLVLETPDQSHGTSSQRMPRNWIRSRRTTHRWSKGHCTPLLDQCNTGPV